MLLASARAHYYTSSNSKAQLDFILLTVHHLSSKRLIALLEFRIWIRGTCRDVRNFSHPSAISDTLRVGRVL